ncbi:glycoside hydrolase domain-containing protein, partial [Planctomycetota bacterium]
MNSFTGNPCRGEYFAFQIGVYAFKQAIEDIDISFSNLTHNQTGAIIPASALTCFNTGGIDSAGENFLKVCSVPKGKIQALWCGVQIPQDSANGEYAGEVTITPVNMEPQSIKLRFNVQDEVLPDAGDSEPWRHSRLRWLNSRLAFDDQTIKPFSPMQLEGNILSCLGRSVTLGKNGFPQTIQSFFTPEVTNLTDQGRDVLSAPIALAAEDSDKKNLTWRSNGFEITKKSPGAIAWQSQSTAGPLTLDCQGQMECDGYLEFKITVSTVRPIRLNDIRLQIPIAADVARYMMGMGLKGGYRPEQYQWKWDKNKNHDAAWIGDVNAGLQFSLRAENYIRPLNTNFYLLKPLNMPPSWYNDGQGGCNFQPAGDDTFLVTAYSGSRTLAPGDRLHYDFNLLLTPFKTLDTKGQWETRYYHSYRPIDQIASLGANTINNHHANEINPYINYPFIRPSQMKEYIDQAHESDLKVKIYYTVRELSNRAPELFALRSLGDEVLSYGDGGGFSWLQEHLGDNYIAAWFVPRLTDAAVINSGVSRWHNYYVEGLNWLTQKVGIDGLYIDDVAFDRTTMKRVRKILDRNRPGALIDLHSANQYNVRDGYVNSANLYLEHFPYINRLWFGEYFDYDSNPDFWLIEVSGIPFGLMGEMLQDGGNPWRGMIYGMTARMPR